MGMGLDELLHEAEVAHGHLCAGQVLGVRMAMLAMRELGVGDPRIRVLENGELNPDRKRLVTFVEIDRCATDAIGVVTGCRVGKRALKLRDFGKMAATFVDLYAKLEGDEYKGLRGGCAGELEGAGEGALSRLGKECAADEGVSRDAG